MCYAIPGKVIEINGDIVTVDYFGERKKARNEFYGLSGGDYIYAQGGFVVQKVSEKDALPVLEAWKEMFFKLQEVDFKLARNTRTLFEKANNLRQRHHGNSCCTHGIIEFSNYCRADCLYCGIRSGNKSAVRYRMSVDEIMDAAIRAVSELRFKALVLQSGEDTWYDESRLSSIVSGIREKAPSLIILSIGERDISIYEKLYDLGARGVLLRFETGNRGLYEKMRPGRILNDRLGLIKNLRKLGYLVMTGFLIGLPGQTNEDVMDDIKLTDSLGADMFSFGPFIPHPGTPLNGSAPVDTETVLEAIAHARILNPNAQILVNTSFETLDKNAVRLGLMAGANSLMINVTPEKYRKLYEIYPGRAGVDMEIKERIDSVISVLRSIGRAPTDLGI